jgi:DNA-binding beta-propeller fold protein YncE
MSITHHFILWFDGTGNDLLEKIKVADNSLVDSHSLGAGEDGGQAVAIDSAGDVYVANMSGSWIQKYSDSTLDYLYSFGSSELIWPIDLTVNSCDEVLVINDATEIAVYDTSGSYQGSFGSFTSALGIAANGDYVFVADVNNGTETIYRYKRN